MMDAYIAKLLEAAKAAGIETAEVCFAESESFSAEAMEGRIDSYEVSATRALGIRGTVGGKMGYALTEAFDETAIDMMVNAVKESAALAEGDEQDEIFGGDAAYPELAVPENDIDRVSAEEKLALVLEMERRQRPWIPGSKKAREPISPRAGGPSRSSTASD